MKLADKLRRYRVNFQASYWPAAADAQGWDPANKQARRDLRRRCWELIGVPALQDAMPESDAQATALFTYCRHLANPNNISLSLEWDKCRAGFEAYNLSKSADHWERRGFGGSGSRRLQNTRFAGRRSAQGGALDDPLSENQAKQRLWKMRQSTLNKERRAKPGRQITLQPDRKFVPRTVAQPDLIPT